LEIREETTNEIHSDSENPQTSRSIQPGTSCCPEQGNDLSAEGIISEENKTCNNVELPPSYEDVIGIEKA
jgi:hypothetical protein